MTFRRIAGLAGLGFAAIVLLVNVVLEAGQPPWSNADPADVAAYFTEKATAVRIGAGFAALNWVLISVFGAGAYLAVSRLERPRGEAWSAVGLMGVAMLNVGFGAVMATRLALTAGNADTESLWHLHNAIFTVNNLSIVVVLLGFSIGGLRTGTLRPWQATLGLVTAAVEFVATLTGFFTIAGGPPSLGLLGFAGWILWLAWLATFGVVLLRPGAGTATATPVPLADGTRWSH